MPSLSLPAKIFATVAALGTATAVAGLGTFGTFTSTTSAAAPVDTGIVKVALGTAGTAANRLTVAAVDIVPGDSVQRAFTLDAATSTSPFASVALTSTATVSSLLDTDVTNGLQLKVEKCLDDLTGASAWVEGGTAPAYTYTCPLGATRSDVVASRAVIGSNVNLPGLKSLTTAAAADNLVLTLTLPTTAGNTFQNIASTIDFAFTATQRAAASK